MKKGRSELERKIILVLDEHSIELDRMEKVSDKLFKNHNIINSSRILSKQVQLSTQPLQVLYFISKYLYETFKRNEVHPDKFFNESEIEEFKDFKYEVKDDIQNVVFEGFKKKQNDIYSGYMKIKDIADLFRYGVATYDTRTQRNTTLTKLKNNKVIEEITLNNKSVSEITNEIKNGDYIPIAPIVFNILKDGNEDFRYDQNKERLVLLEGALNCTDGFHRSMAILNAIDDPKLPPELLDLEFPVIVTHFTIKKARKMIGQEAKKNEMSKEYIKSLDDDSLENYIINDLSEMKELKGKITTDTNALQLNVAYVTRKTLEYAIQHNFKYENRRDARRISEFLQDGFIEIFGIFNKEFDNIKEYKNKTVVVRNTTFIGYIALLAELKNKDRWRTKLEDTLDNVDFNIDNPIWKEIGVLSNTINKARTKKISNYFKSLIRSEN